MGVLSLFLGLISFVWIFNFQLFYIFLELQPILSLLGMIFGIIAIKKGVQKGLAVIGFICSVVAFLYTLFFIL